KCTPPIVALARQFVAHGFVVMTIDSPLRGERAPRDMNRLALLRAQFDRNNFLHYCGDYSRAVDYLASRPEVDAARLGYVGISWGAITGITFVAHDPRIQVMASVVAGGDFLGPIFGHTPEEAKAIAREIDPVNHVGQIAPRPLLLLNMTQDKLIARPYAEALHKAAGKGSTIIWLNTDHDFHGPDHDKVAPTVIKFLEEHLRGSTPSAAASGTQEAKR
ncbi:MAG: dienelactone hydrolase family protein, partial [Planctomycetes bacterium]|nr:dienelactone hydrolase family protein [Planctomycetota bacterium]